MPHILRNPAVPLAYEFLPGRAPVVVFCPGYGSDMNGTKALALEAYCRAQGRAMLRFDYAGHGQSGGDFQDGTIGDWTADAAFIIEQIVPAEPIILVGSSMGGWIALLLGRMLGARLAGLILIAPAADFTARLIRPALSPAHLAQLRKEGVIYQPSDYGAPQPLTLKFIDEGDRHLLLGASISITCPVDILHGMRDDAVPWRHSLLIAEQLASTAVRLTYLKDGDHRLSRPEDLALLEESLARLLGEYGA